MPPLSDPQERRCLYGHINLIQEHPLWSGCFLYIEIVLQIVCVFKYFYNLLYFVIRITITKDIYLKRPSQILTHLIKY